MSDDCAVLVADVTIKRRKRPPAAIAEGFKLQLEGTVYEPSVFGVGVVCAEVRGDCGKIAIRKSERRATNASQIKRLETNVLNRGG